MPQQTARLRSERPLPRERFRPSATSGHSGPWSATPVSSHRHLFTAAKRPADSGCEIGWTVAATYRLSWLVSTVENKEISCLRR